MTTRLVIKRSAEPRMLWSWFALLDQVPEGAAGRLPFVRKVLRQLGVAGVLPRRELEQRILARLPPDLDQVGMDVVLAAFEAEVPILWEEDRTRVDAAVASEIESIIRSALAASDKTTVPRQVIERILPELRRLLGPALAESDVPALWKDLDRTLCSDLWDARDPESQEELTRSLMEDLESAARLALPAIPPPRR